VTNARRRTLPSLAAAALAVAAMLAVPGCDPASQVTSSTHPDITTAGAEAIYQTYLTTSDSAAAAGNSVSGLSNVTNAAWAVAHSQYTALVNNGAPVTRYQYGTPTFYVPIVNNYPHWFMTEVQRRPAGSDAASVTTLMVFAKATASDVWALAGAAELAPGQSVPAIARDARGYATALATYDQSLLLPPDLVGATQAAVADEGPAAEAASEITEGPQTTGVYTQQTALSKTQAASGLNYTWFMAGAGFPVFTLRTADGGALVLYGMYLETTNEHPDAKAGTPIPIPADVSAQFTVAGQVGLRAVEANYTYEYAAVDPPASATTAKATIIAATGALTYAHAS
jgi:hypothetical protein